MKNQISLITIISLSLLTLINNKAIAQLSKEYINEYERSFQSSEPYNIQISNTGNNYSYRVSEKHVNIHVNGKILRLNCNDVHRLYDDALFYKEKNLLKKVFLSKKDYSKDTAIGEITSTYVSDQTIAYIINKKDVIILSPEHYTSYSLVNNVSEYGYNINKTIIINLREKSIIIQNNSLIEIKEKIDFSIYGIEENLLLSKDYIYRINKNNKKITKIENYIYKEVSSILKSDANPLYFENNIYFNQTKDTTIIKEYYLSDTTLDIDYFLELSTNKKKQKINNINEININTRKISNKYRYVNRLSNIYTSNKTITKERQGIIINSFFVYNNNVISKKILLYNIVYDIEIEPDSLVKDMKSFEITPDCRFMFLINKNNDLFMFDFKKKYTNQVLKKFPSKQTTLEFQDSIENIILSHYDYTKKISYFTTKYNPIFIDSIGKVDSIFITKDQFTYTIIENIQNENNIITYTLNEENGFSEIKWINNDQKILLTNNQSFKYPEHKLYGPQKDDSRGMIKITREYIAWTEANLLTGTKLYIYNFTKKSKKELNFVQNKRHDSLNYKYFSYFDGQNLIKGGIKYPKNYDSAQKYPVIFSIYVNKMHLFHYPTRYINEAYWDIKNETSSALMNELNLLHQGYAIAYIDLPIKNGMYTSHSYYINIIIKNVLSNIKGIDVNNVAIMGHSRSGGQALGALIDDDLIKCAIISNGILSDLLDVTQFSEFDNPSRNSNRKTSRFTRRLANSTNSNYDFFDDLKNNFSKIIQTDPFFNLKKINSSILFLLNDEDISISSSNGYFTYIKTKLLGKNTYFLNFHEESHVINKKENKQKAYNIMIHFLNFYLKERNTNDSWQYNEK